MPRTASLAAAVALVVITPIAPASGLAEEVVIAIDGDFTPGGERFRPTNTPSQTPVAGPGGEVIFGSFLSDGTEGLFAHTPTGLVELAKGGDAAPGTTGTFDAPTQKAIGVGGDALFSSLLTLPAGQRVAVLFSGDVTTGNVGPVTTPATPAPGGGSFVLTSPGLDAGPAGTAVFGGRVTDGGTTVSASFVADGLSLVELVRDGAPSPASGFNFNGGGSVSLSDTGQLATTVSLRSSTDGTFAGSALLAGTVATGQQVVARRGTPVPGGDTLRSIGDAVVNASGQIAFDGSLTNAAGRRLFRRDADGEIVTLASEGDAVASGVLGAPGFVRRITDDGGVVFRADALDPDDAGASRQGVFRVGDAGIHEIAIESAAAGAGVSYGFRDGFFRNDVFEDVVMNASGQVAFRSYLRGDGIDFSNDQALLFFDPRLGLIEVARRQEQFAGRTLTGFSIETGTNESTDGLGDDGTLAFVALFEGGRGFATWTPPSLEDLIPGDATLDGTVNLADFGLLRANFGSDDAFFTTGDFNGDGLVTLADFGLLRANFGGTTAQLATLDAWAATVPEPTFAALSLGGLTLLRRRR